MVEVDFLKIPGVYDIWDDRFKDTESRKILEEQIERMAKEVCEEIDNEILRDIIDKKAE